jgi:hypothetical protein
MIEVELTTKQGEHVTSVSLIPMNPLPEIIQWGSRFFVEVEGKNKQRPIYREAFAIFTNHDPK